MPTVVKLPNGRELRNFKPVTDQMGRGEISLVRLETPKEKIKFKYDPMGQCELALNNDVEYRLIIERNPVDKGGELYPEEELEKALDILFADLYQRVGKRAKADQIVVGLPLSYSDVGRKRIIQSLLNSKWAKQESQVLLFPEPLAIALRCGLDYKTSGKQRFLVVDHGGGTLDMCLFDLESTGKDFHIKVIGQRRCDIAGNKFDECLLDWIMQRNPAIKDKLKVENAKEVTNIALWDVVERCKIELSSQETTRLTFRDSNIKLNMTLKRTDLEEALASRLEKINEEVTALFEQVDVNEDSLDMVFLAGGSSSMPCIQQCFGRVFGSEKVEPGYTGSGVLAENLALVPKYFEMIERLCEYTYGIWDSKNRQVVTIVEAGSLLTPKTEDITGTRFEIRPEGKKIAPLIIFGKQGERWKPVYQVNVLSPVTDTVKIIPKLNREKSILDIKLQAGGKFLETMNYEYHKNPKYQPPVVYAKQFVRKYNDETDYFIESIRDIGSGKDVEMAAGDLHDYRFRLNRYHINSKVEHRVDKGHGLAICRIDDVLRLESMDIMNLLTQNSFYPVIEVEGDKYSIIQPGSEVKRSKAKEEIRAGEKEAAAILGGGWLSLDAEDKKALHKLKKDFLGYLDEILYEAWELGRQKGRSEVSQESNKQISGH